MSGLVFNFRNKDFDNSFKALEAGDYVAQVSEATFSFSKSSGAPMITFVYEVTTPEGKTAKVWDYMTIAENTQWKVAQVMSAFSVPYKEKDVEFTNTFDEKEATFPLGPGLKFAMDETGKHHFLGFITTDDSEFYSVLGTPIKLTLTKSTYKNNAGEDQEKNNVSFMEALSTNKPVSQKTENTGGRPQLR